ncbi:hypothetical protein [Mycolicibacter algericus]|uniref:hypothetical protein n=1 Tax=Mycolicibacter algericus TaxID=1288388 RepID=UPI003C74C48B
MKLIILGVAAGGAAAAFLTAATAGAEVSETPGTWTPTYNIDTAEILQAANSFTNTWAVTSIFTHSDGEALAGTTYLTPSTGGLNALFIDDATGDIYNQNQLGLGFTNLYYDADGDGKDVVDILKTPFGNIDISSMAAWFAPADVADLTPASPLEALENAGLYSVLNLGLGEDAPADVTWNPTYALDGAQLLDVNDPLSQTWKLAAAFTNDDGEMLSGTNYITQSLFGGGINNQFVTTDGDVYAQHQLGLGFTNLYYDADGDGKDVIDILKTPFGNFDISSMASWFAPTDFSDVDAVSPVADLEDAGLYSVLDLGLLTPDV